MCHRLVEASSNTVQDDIDQVMVSHLGIDIKSINIIAVVLDSTCLFEITDLVKSPVCLVVIVIVFPYGLLDFFLSSISVPIRFPPS